LAFFGPDGLLVPGLFSFSCQDARVNVLQAGNLLLAFFCRVLQSGDARPHARIFDVQFNGDATFCGILNADNNAMHAKPSKHVRLALMPFSDLGRFDSSSRFWST
jgi:hypothetical protein